MSASLKQSVLAGALLLVLPMGLTFAHVMPRGKGTINLIDSKAYLVISLPVAAFKHVDTNQNGQLEPDEWAKGKSSLIDQFKAGIQLTNATWGKVLPNLTQSTHQHSSKKPATNQLLDQPKDIIFMAIGLFSKPPQTITFQSSLWETREQKLQPTLNIRAVHTNKNTEAVQEYFEFSSKKNIHTFFRRKN